MHSRRASGRHLLADALAEAEQSERARAQAEAGNHATQRLEASDLPRALIHPGLRIGTWQIERCLGEGGYGRVYAARDVKTDKRVALKVLDQRSEVRKAFQREARAGMRINAPGVARVHGMGTHNDAPYLVLDYVEGRPLFQLLDGPRIRTRRLARIGAGIARALAEVHAAGLAHRDLKGGNVLLGPNDEVTLIDFGFAAFLQESQGEGPVGTPGFWAPEVYLPRERRRYDPFAADLYALGCLLHLCAVKRLPHARDLADPRDREAADALLARRAKADRRADKAGLVAARVPRRLAKVIAALLRRDPALRPGVDEVAEVLARLGAPSSTRPRPAPGPAAEWGWSSASSSSQARPPLSQTG